MPCRDERAKEALLELALRTGPTSAGYLAVVKVILEDDVVPLALSQRQKDTREVTAAAPSVAASSVSLPTFRVRLHRLNETAACLQESDALELKLMEFLFVALETAMIGATKFNSVQVRRRDVFLARGSLLNEKAGIHPT